MSKPSAFDEWANQKWNDHKETGAIRDWQQRQITHNAYEKALGRAFWNAALKAAAQRIRDKHDIGLLRLRGVDEAVRIVESLLEESE